MVYKTMLDDNQRRAVIEMTNADPTLSMGEIARRLHVSYEAARYWVNRYRALGIAPAFDRKASPYANLNGGVSDTEKVRRFLVRAGESHLAFAAAMNGRLFENVPYQESPFTQIARPHAPVSLIGCAAKMCAG
jgi:hypothetical protein